MPRSTHLHPNTLRRFLLLTCIIGTLTACNESTPPAHQQTSFPDTGHHYPPTPLDQYIAREDASFQWQIAKTTKMGAIDLQTVNMTSQTWQPPGEVNQPRWRHWLVISKPKTLASDTALLFISSGKTDETIPDAPRKNLEQIARRTGAITAELRAIPNQHLIFNGDGQGRKEDDLLAYTWARYLETGDPDWPAQLPMVKSVVRAMDTLQALHGIEKFVVAGASKRGWTTWLTGAVDKRVVAMVPIVIDVLNVVPSLEHHREAYGYWSPALNDYVRHGIMASRHTPRFNELMALVDPFSYRARYTQPKYLINASGDQFFLPDSSRFYFDQLPGEKYLRYVPNTKHNLKHSDALESLEAYFLAIIHNAKRPEFSWRQKGLAIEVHTKSRPSNVRLWQASNPNTRDFRLDTIGSAWKDSVLSAEADGESYIGKVTPPDSGWTAFFVELTFAGINGSGNPGEKAFPLKFTTPVSVVPQRLPFSSE